MTESQVIERQRIVEPYLPEAANVLASIFQAHDNVRMHLENGTAIHDSSSTEKAKVAIANRDFEGLKEANRKMELETLDSRLTTIRRAENYEGVKAAMLDVFKTPNTVVHVLETATDDFDKSFEDVYRGGRYDSSIIEEDEDGVLREQLDAIKIETKSLIERLKQDFSSKAK